MHQDATWYGGRPQPRGLCVRWRHSPLPKKGAESPQFSHHVYCGQRAGWINMALGMEVGLSPSDVVLDRDPAFLKRGGDPSTLFDSFLLCPSGWMHQDATWYRGRPRSKRHCVIWGPAPLPKKGTGHLPNFRPMSIVAKRLDGSKWHLAWRWALVQATLCQMGNQLPSLKRGQPPNFRPIFIVAKRLDE